MRGVRLTCILLFLAAAVPPARADSSPVLIDDADIHLGAEFLPRAPEERDRVDAVEEFLAARQEGSIDRSLGSRARTLLAASEPISDTVLFGSRNTALAAFNFHDDSIEIFEPNPEAFGVTVYLLFADTQGQVVESRDEELWFERSEEGFVCVALRPVNVIAWSHDDVFEAARSVGASRELDRARSHLRDWTGERSRMACYSLADVQRGSDGEIVVQCLRFQAGLGRRGFDVTTTPLVLGRSGRDTGSDPH